MHRLSRIQAFREDEEVVLIGVLIFHFVCLDVHGLQHLNFCCAPQIFLREKKNEKNKREAYTTWLALKHWQGFSKKYYPKGWRFF
jgi:hypothetical protein